MPRAPKLDITNRKPMQWRTVTSIVEEAVKLGGFAAAVFDRQRRIDEVHLYRDGALVASVFSPIQGGLAIWSPGRVGRVANVKVAVSRGLRNRTSDDGNPRVLAA